MKLIKTAAIYIKDGESAATQLKEFTHHCSQLGWQVSKVYTGHSGKLNKKTRHNLLRDAQIGVFQALTVQKFSSIFESVNDAITFLSLLHKYGIEFFSALDDVLISQQSFEIINALKVLRSDITRSQIRKGVMLAKLQGANVGRPSVPPELKVEVLALRSQGLSIRAIEKRMNRRISKSAISRLCSKTGDKI